MDNFPNRIEPNPGESEHGATGPRVVPDDAPNGGHSRSRRWIVRVCAVLVVAVLAMAGYWAARAKSRPQQAALASVPEVTATSGEVDRMLRVSGTVTAQRMTSLTAPRVQGSRTGMNRGGTDLNFGGGAGAPGGGDFNLVLLTLAKPGAAVREGAVVAQFDTQNMVQRLDDYRDSVVQLEENVRKMISSLAATKVTHDQTVAATKAAWEQAQLDLQTAPIRASIDAERYKLAVEEAEATYKQTVEETPYVDASQQAQIRSTQLNLQQSQIELQRAEVNLQKMTVKTPMNGIVVMPSIIRNGELGQVREGDQVFPGQAFMQIVDPSSLVLNASVNQVDAERVRLGMPARVRMDAYPDLQVTGRVTGIGALSQTSTFRSGYVGEIPVRVAIDRIDPRILPDLTGNAEILLGAENAEVTVPRAAVFQDGDGSFVYVRSVNGWEKRQVTTGLSSNTIVAIHSGLRKGEKIALTRPM